VGGGKVTSTNEQPLIKDVSDTSFWVAYYRAKESERPDAMFRDPYAKLLVGHHGKEISDSMGVTGKYTSFAVITRTVIIDRFIEKWISEGVDAVINLGAGLDARPYRMNLPASLPWIEVDYSNIIEHKTKILKNETPRCRLTRIAFDLADEQKRKELFRTLVPEAKKVLILTEGVIPYLSPEQVAALAKDLKNEERFCYWITEYINPKVYKYLKQSLRRAKMQNAPFKFYPTNWFEFFKQNGWVEKETRYTGEIGKEFNRLPPMPLFFRMIFPIMPQKTKEQAGKMSGYTTLRKI
jgi:methyltransferase (TIGR00027 family)